MRRYAEKYRESLKKGTIGGMVIGTFELKYKSRIFKPDARVQFPKCEKKLFEKFKELRKVGIPVGGKYLKAKMLEIVGENADAAKQKMCKRKAP